MQMNSSVDKSIILPDQYKHLTQNDQKKIRRLKVIIIIIVIITIALLGTSIIMFATAQSISSLQEQRNQLEAQSSRLNAQNTKLSNECQEKVGKNQQLQAQQTNLTNQLQSNNELIDALLADIAANCNPFYQKLKFNQTNLNKVAISVSDSSNSRSIFAYLNISNNNVGSFTDNNLPDLQVLDLSYNPITKISNNNLPKTNQLRIQSISTLQQFSHNVLSSIITLNLTNNNITSFAGNTFTSLSTLLLDKNRLSQFSNYDLGSLKYLSLLQNSIQQMKGNIIPNLQTLMIIKDKSVTPRSISNNYFGKITEFSLNDNGGTLGFTNNYFPELLQFTITNSQITNYTLLASNKMPLLSKLKFQQVTITNFQYLQEFKFLQRIEFYGKGVDSITNHFYPKLQVLFVNSTTLDSFQNNNLPSLLNLTIMNSPLISSISMNNTMPNLKIVQLKSNKRLFDVDYLKSVVSLQELTLSTHSVETFNSYQLPALKYLTIQKGPLFEFTDNSLPSLKYLTLQAKITTLQFKSFEKTLETAVFKCQIQSYSNANFESLKTLQITASNSSNLVIANNTFSSLYKLQVYSAKSLTLSNNDFQRRLLSLYFNQVEAQLVFNPDLYNPVSLTIYYCKINNFTNHHNFVEYLTLKNVGLKEYSNNSLPVAVSIDLGSNKLTTLDCSGMPQIRSLALESNQLRADIADRIIGCNLKKLQSLNLLNNSISEGQKQNLVRRLKQKYPNIEVYI